MQTAGHRIIPVLMSFCNRNIFSHLNALSIRYHYWRTIVATLEYQFSDFCPSSLTFATLNKNPVVLINQYDGNHLNQS